MPNSFQRPSSQNISGPLRSFAFFVLFYLYLWLDVNTRLIYHGGGITSNFPVFYKGWDFFHKFISYPGGAVEYLSALLSQFFYYSWAGALVITLQAWLICLCTGRFIKAIQAPQLYWVRFVPPILMLIVYTKYAYHFATTMALLTSLVFVCIYLRLSLKSQPLRLIVFLVLSVILYYAAAGAYLLFAVLCAAYELFFTRRRPIGFLYFLSALAIPYIEGVLVFGVSIINAFSDLMPFSWKTLSYEERRRMVTVVYVLYLFLPFAAILLVFWQSFAAGSKQAASDVPGSGETNRKLKEKRNGKFSGIVSLYFRNNKLRWVIESLVLFLVAGSVVSFSYDRKLKALFEVDYYSCRRMWPQVLAAGRAYPNSYFVIHAVNRALYHTGKLGSEMFSYPQHPDALLLTAKEQATAHWKKFDAYIDLGVMNTAEGKLTESLVLFGERPVILKRLALVNMVKGNIGAARIYLGALGKTLFNAGWANNYLSRLDSDPDLSMDREIQQMRRLMTEKDYGSLSFSNEDTFLALLNRNRKNRMAFEYLMAWYLLTDQLEKIVENIDLLDDFDYPEIPPLYGEAMLLYSSVTKKSVDLKGHTLNPQLLRRFEAVNQTLYLYGGNNQAAFNELARNYGDSYIFYYLYGTSGQKK